MIVRFQLASQQERTVILISALLKLFDPHLKESTFLKSELIVSTLKHGRSGTRLFFKEVLMIFLCFVKRSDWF